jgi:hypothetical protein
MKINRIGDLFENSTSSHPSDMPDYLESVNDNLAAVSICIDGTIFQRQKKVLLVIFGLYFLRQSFAKSARFIILISGTY